MVVTDIKKETANTSSQAPKQPNDNVELEQGSVQQAGSTGNVELEQESVRQVGSAGNVEAKQGAVQQGPNDSAAVASINQQPSVEAPSAQVASQTREQLKKERAQGNVGAEAEQPETDTETKSNKRMRVRLIPIWLRLIILFLAMVFSLVIGAMVGYGTIGGGNAWDVLKQSTWTHIVDIINKE